MQITQQQQNEMVNRLRQLGAIIAANPEPVITKDGLEGLKEFGATSYQRANRNLAIEEAKTIMEALMTSTLVEGTGHEQLTGTWGQR